MFQEYLLSLLVFWWSTRSDMRSLALLVIISALSIYAVGMNVSSQAKYNASPNVDVKKFKNDTMENNSINLNNNDMIETSCHVMTEELTAIAKVSVSSALENLCNYSSIISTIEHMEHQIKNEIEGLKKILYNLLDKISVIQEKNNKVS